MDKKDALLLRSYQILMALRTLENQDIEYQHESGNPQTINQLIGALLYELKASRPDLPAIKEVVPLSAYLEAERR